MDGYVGARYQAFAKASADKPVAVLKVDICRQPAKIGHFVLNQPLFHDHANRELS